MEANAIAKLTSNFPARENQIEMLNQLLLQDDLDKNNATKLLLYGPSNTGKTAVLLKLLELAGKFYVFVNCMGCYQPRLLFESILRQLCEKLDDKEEYDNLAQFVNHFKKLSAFETNFDYLILKNCSMLGESYIRAFINLPRILSKEGWNFRTVFIEQNTSDYMESSENHVAKIFFPRYNKSELSDILLVLRPHYPREIYENFLRIFLSCVYHLHRDLFEVLQLADVAFANYKKPIDDNKIPASNLQALYKNLVKTLKLEPKNLLYVFPQSLLPHQEEYESMKLSADLELPKKTKYLLIAAYIASFVSPKYDKRLFCRQSSKKKKRNQNPLGDCPGNKIASLLGPKQFTLNRLLNIFSALTAQRNSLTASLLQQVTFLVELKMLVLVGNNDGSLDRPRYKCIADFDFVASLARSLNCDFERYLIE